VLRNTGWHLIAFQLLLIILFAITTGGGKQYTIGDEGKSGVLGYSMFSGVEIMMFIGFGYLMTFMKWYGVSAVGFTMVLVALALQWAVLTEAFFAQWMELDDKDWHYVNVDIYALLDSLYAVSAVLITFGALIGKVTPLQLLIVTIIELGLHSLNFKVILGGLYVSDLGGTYIDHMFGGYFGLAVAYMLGKPNREPEGGHSSDLFSFIGTLFLWIYWPSFVAGAAEPNSIQQQVAIVNTILALGSGTVTAFFFSSYMHEKGLFRPVDIQNATLAGGVAVGCVANLSIKPVGAILIGCIASAVSTYGFNTIQPYLEKEWGIHDTCGIHNLHALPSIIGGIASVIVCAINSETDKEIFGDKADSQWWRQLVGMGATLGFALVTGIITGWICQQYAPEANAIADYEDSEWWETAEDYGAGGEIKEATENPTAEGEAAAGGEVEMTEA
jgi:ammonium transporter Rh